MVPGRPDGDTGEQRDEQGPLSGFSLNYRAPLEEWPKRLRARFVELRADAGTRAFLLRAEQNRHGALRTWLHRVLRHTLSDFDVNGLLDMYPMHLLSTGQWQELLGPRSIARCLDVGAGSGDVSVELAPLCGRL